MDQRQILVVGNFHYSKTKAGLHKQVYYRCRTRKCGARGILKGDQFELTFPHNDIPHKNYPKTSTIYSQESSFSSYPLQTINVQNIASGPTLQYVSSIANPLSNCGPAIQYPSSLSIPSTNPPICAIIGPFSIVAAGPAEQNTIWGSLKDLQPHNLLHQAASGTNGSYSSPAQKLNDPASLAEEPGPADFHCGQTPIKIEFAAEFPSPTINVPAHDNDNSKSPQKSTIHHVGNQRKRHNQEHDPNYEVYSKKAVLKNQFNAPDPANLSKKVSSSIVTDKSQENDKLCAQLKNILQFFVPPNYIYNANDVTNFTTNQLLALDISHLKSHYEDELKKLMTPRCINSPDSFCYVCGKYITANSRKHKITNKLEFLYEQYFGIPLNNHDKPFAPHFICSPCYSGFLDWHRSKRPSLKMTKPMIWREITDHGIDCYFCLTNVFGHNRKNSKKIIYPDVSTAIKPTYQSPISHDIMCEDEENVNECDTKPILFSRQELDDFIKELGLSKCQAELCISRLREKNLLEPNCISLEANDVTEDVDNFDISCASMMDRPQENIFPNGLSSD